MSDGAATPSRVPKAKVIMTQIVELEYHGHQVSLQSDGWFNATQAAAKYGKAPVIYCIRFKNGLCKVGMTKNLNRRVVELAGHGLWCHMFIEVLAFEAGGKHLGNTEALALNMFASIAERRGKEVFVDPGSEVASTVLRNAVAECLRDGRRPSTNGTDDYGRVAKESGIWNAIEWLAMEKRRQQTEDEAIRFALDVFNSKSDFDVSALMDDLHPFCEPLAAHLVERNAMLIGMGLTYEQRKGALKVDALQFAGRQVTKLEAA